ncbi:MAG: hypothetical protein U9P38_02160 [Campylobacterota bacterium]|nr:hypothetical protein [Campylobacterota bacterium]
MKIDIEIKHSLDEILAELNHENSGDIISLKHNTKFFVGRGCEIPYTEDMGDDFNKERTFMTDAYIDSQRHLAICTDNIKF